MWQSQELAGALSFGASVPEEKGTRCSSARLSLRDIPPAAARAARPAFLINARRSFSSLVMVSSFTSRTLWPGDYCSAYAERKGAKRKGVGGKNRKKGGLGYNAVNFYLSPLTFLSRPTATPFAFAAASLR